MTFSEDQLLWRVWRDVERIPRLDELHYSQWEQPELQHTVAWSSLRHVGLFGIVHSDIANWLRFGGLERRLWLQQAPIYEQRFNQFFSHSSTVF